MAHKGEYIFNEKVDGSFQCTEDGKNNNKRCEISRIQTFASIGWKFKYIVAHTHTRFSNHLIIIAIVVIIKIVGNVLFLTLCIRVAL